jgi:peptidoglycan/LPS O-acetylase OafA/YrhL
MLVMRHPAHMRNGTVSETPTLTRHIPSLDGLRAISIALVLVAHLLGTAGFLKLHERLDLGGVGVRIFFIISGFLITTLLLNELDSTGRISLRGFYRRRILRIFPAFYAYWLTMLVLTLAGLLAIRGRDLVYAALYTINYVLDRPWYLGHLWSLAVEEQFYALWPLTLFLVGRRKAFWAAGAVVVLVPFVRIAQSHYFPAQRLGIMEEFHTIADCIATGCLLAGLRGWMWEHAGYRRFLSSWMFWLAPATIFATVALNRFTLFKWLIAIPLFNFSIAICIDRWTRFAHEDYFARFLNLKPVAFVGVLSYSLYLWQQPFLNRYAQHAWTRFPLNIVIAVLLALTSYYIVEKPFLALRYRTSKRPSPAVEVLKPAAEGDSFQESA